MKKRVRIYKPVNQFEDGGAQVEAQAQPAQPQYTDKQLISAMMQMMSDTSNPVSLDEAQAMIAEQVGGQKAASLRYQVEGWIEEQQIMDKANIANDDEAGEDMYLTDQADNLAADEEVAAEAAHDARMQQMYYDESSSQDYSDDDQFASELVARYGGNMHQSRYGNSVSRLLRKADGGDQQPQEPKGKYVADSTGKDLRAPYDPKTYAKKLQNHANQSLIKNDLKALAEAAKQQEQLSMFTGSQGNEPVEDSDFDMPEAQFGGMSRGRQRRMERRMERRADKMVGQFPVGMYDKRSSAFPSQFNFMTLPQGMGNVMPARGYVNDGVKLANIDVRRTGLFGRPKEYSITFAQEAYNNPQVRQDVIKQEQNNKAEEVKDQAAEDKAKDQSTESSNNAAVQNAETPTTANEEADVKVEDIQVVSGNNAARNSGAGNTSETAVDENEESEQVQEGRTQNEQPVDPANMKIDYNRYFPGAKQIDQNKYKNMSLQDEINNYLEGPGRDVYDPEYTYTYDSKGNPQSSGRYTEEAIAGSGESPTWKTWDSSNGRYQEFVVYNDKLYKRLVGDDNTTEWNEVTDPQRIRTVTTSMKEAGYKPEGGQKPINFKAKNSEVFISPNTYGDAGYVFRNGKLYKAPKFSRQAAGEEQWYEVTDPTRIATIKRDMQKKGMKVPGSSSAPTKSPLTNPLDMAKGITDNPIFKASQLIFDEGGFTDSSNPNLYKFVYGGDDPAIPMLQNDPYEYQSKNVNDPYFAYGGLYRFQGEEDSETDSETNTNTDVTTDEDAGTTTTDNTATTTTQEVSANRRKYDALNELGVNVGNYQEGIDYSKLNAEGKGRQTQGATTQQYSPYAMYPPLFNRGNRRAAGTNIFGGPKAIQYAGSWMQQKGLPYDPRTGKPVGAVPTDLPLTKIDVTKTGMFGRRPKEYTMYFGDYGQSGSAAPQTKAELDASKTSSRDANRLDRRNRFAETLMRTPGLRNVGARMYRDPNLPLPEGTQYTGDQVPSLPVKPINTTPGTSDLVPDQYNKLNEPKLDIEGLQDVEVPEVTPEEFSFADQQRFGNVEGPQEQPAAQTYPYVNEFGFPVSAPSSELQRFTGPAEQPAEKDYSYVNEFGFPVNQPVMKDISGNEIQEGQGVPMNIAGPMSDMANLPDEQGYFNDLQLEQNQEQRIANLPPESASQDYYQDVMQPNRDRSEYDFSTDQMLTPEERAQQAQENLEGFDPMRLPDESGSMPEPWMTQGKVDAQVARIKAAEERKRIRAQRIAAQRQAEERGQKESEQNTSGGRQRNNQGNTQQTQVAKPIKTNNNGTIEFGKDASIEAISNSLYRQGYSWDEVSAGIDWETGTFDPKKVETFRKESAVSRKKAEDYQAWLNSPEGKKQLEKEERARQTEEIKGYGVPAYSNYKTNNDLFKAIKAGHVKLPGAIILQQKNGESNEGFRARQVQLEQLTKNYDKWLTTQPDVVAYQVQELDGKVYDVYGDGRKVLAKNQNMEQTTLEENQKIEREAREEEGRGKLPAWYRNISGQYAYGGMTLPQAQFAGTFNSGSASQYGFNYNPNSMDSEENQFNAWWRGLDPNRTNEILAQQERDLDNMGAYDVDLKAEDAAIRDLAEDDMPGTQYDFEKKDPFAIKLKRRDMFNIDAPLAYGQFKGGLGMGQNLLNEFTTGRRNTRDSLINTYAETVEPTNQRRDIGSWHKLSGDYTPNRTGFDFDIQDRQSNAKHGGSMQDGQVTYMSADQVKKFLDEGGELEFI
jgi:hypothetical protein